MDLDWREHGVEIVPQLITPLRAQALAEEVAVAPLVVPRHGIRNAEARFAGIGDLSRDPLVLEVVAGYLEGSPQLVRAIFFDKTPDSNWLVTWHQDRTIAVSGVAEIEGWGPWSVKEGVHHVQPTVEVLNQMVTVRIHLDAADNTNGCLKVIPGSHARGIIDSRDVAAICKQSEVMHCVIGVGDAVVMRPHILHASSKAQNPGHRRVVHLEYSCYELPAGLRWL